VSSWHKIGIGLSLLPIFEGDNFLKVERTKSSYMKNKDKNYLRKIALMCFSISKTSVRNVVD